MKEREAGERGKTDLDERVGFRNGDYDESSERRSLLLLKCWIGKTNYSPLMPQENILTKTKTVLNKVNYSIELGNALVLLR